MHSFCDWCGMDTYVYTCTINSHSYIHTIKAIHISKKIKYQILIIFRGRMMTLKCFFLPPPGLDTNGCPLAPGKCLSHSGNKEVITDCPIGQVTMVKPMLGLITNVCIATFVYPQVFCQMSNRLGWYNGSAFGQPQFFRASKVLKPLALRASDNIN
jgi:hypothetical protein